MRISSVRKPLFDWAQLDGKRFQELCAAVLSQEGYEVENQGIGPDGGIDLIVTEHISLTIGRDHKYRWAVQAKYKQDPNQTVRPSDLGNIANLLVRFKADGFLLITNARVTSKTYQQIRSVETAELRKYAAHVWEREQLESKLLKHRRLRQQFFTKVTRPLVLLVDDDIETLHAWKSVLASLDVEICTAGDAALALRVARERPPTVALLDIMLTPHDPVPGDGFRLASELRAISPETKIVYLSGYMATPEIAVRAGIENALFFSKFDVDAARLRQVVSDALGTPVEIAARAQQFETVSTFVNRKLHQIVGKMATARLLCQAQGAAALPKTIDGLDEALRALKGIMHDLALERFAKTSGQFGEINLVTVLSRTIAASRRLHGDAPVELRVPEKEILLRGDAEALEAALGALLDNALEASGTPAWTHTRAELEIISRERDYAKISISDSGTGILSETLTKMYIPGTTTKSGTGMGFFLATKIAEFHGGWIEVQSPAGEWSTTVSIQLPIQTVRLKVARQSSH